MIAIALLIISAIIGAGFVSGAEILRFFGQSQIPIFLIAPLSGLFLFFVQMMGVYLNEKKFHHRNVIFLPIYFVFYVAMTAALLHLIGFLGTLVALGFCIAIVIFGFDKLMGFNKYLIYLIIAVLLFTVIPNVRFSHPTGDATTIATFASIILFGGLNSILFPIFKRSRERYSLKTTIIACAIASGVLCILVFLMLSSINHDTTNPFPILDLGNNFFVLASIFLAVFSSQFISLFNIDTEIKIQKKYRILVLSLISVFALIFAGFGFTTIVSRVYPIIGIFMIFYLITSCAICLILSRKNRRQSQLKENLL
ncbi:MAG: hypothetical protein FWE16_05365 [Firmicutes bacterium]|nr:hypothetical protein [Bacillota bacterium]